MPGKADSQYTGAESVIDKVAQNGNIDKQKFPAKTPIEQTAKQFIFLHNLIVDNLHFKS